MPRMSQEDREYFGYKGELNIRFGIQHGEIAFYETPEHVDNVKVFATFEEAKNAAIPALAEYQKDIIALFEVNARKVSEANENEVFGYNPDGGW